MSLALASRKDDEAMRERKCIVSGEVREEAQLIRFVVSPDGDVVPDVAAKLPGRGIWVSADRQSVEKAVAKNHFSKAAKANVRASAGLSDLVEKQIVRRMSDDLGLAKRAGQLVTGFDSVVEMLQGPAKSVLLVEASDGAADGRRKLLGVARAQGAAASVVDCLTNDELSLALGLGNVIHAALKAGPLAQRLIFEAGRLAGFRKPEADAGSNPAHKELND